MVSDRRLRLLLDEKRPEGRDGPCQNRQIVPGKRSGLCDKTLKMCICPFNFFIKSTISEKVCYTVRSLYYIHHTSGHVDNHVRDRGRKPASRLTGDLPVKFRRPPRLVGERAERGGHTFAETSCRCADPRGAGGDFHYRFHQTGQCVCQPHNGLYEGQYRQRQELAGASLHAAQPWDGAGAGGGRP